MVPAGKREVKNAALKGTCRTQEAYESCLRINLGSVLIQGNPLSAPSRLSPVDDPAQTVKNGLTTTARSHEFGVTIGHVSPAPASQSDYSPYDAGVGEVAREGVTEGAPLTGAHPYQTGEAGRRGLAARTHLSFR